jgi:hypothetical protein
MKDSELRPNFVQFQVINFSVIMNSYFHQLRDSGQWFPYHCYLLEHERALGILLHNGVP